MLFPLLYLHLCGCCVPKPINTMAYTLKDHDDFYRPEFIYSESATNTLDLIAFSHPDVNPIEVERLVEVQRQEIISPTGKPSVTSLGVPGTAGYKATSTGAPYQVAFQLAQDRILLYYEKPTESCRR